MTTQQPASEDPDHAGYSFFHTDWFTSGWARILPRHQSLMLCMAFGTASVKGLRGSLDDIARVVFGEPVESVFRGLGASLDSPALWLEPDDLEDAEEPEDEIRAATDRHQATIEGALRKAGIPAPVTIRDIGTTMTALGIVSQAPDGSWSMPETLPRPEDVLELPEEMVADFREMRRMEELTPGEQAIIRYLTEDQDYPEELFTSLDRLAKAVELDVDKVRPALDFLVEQGDARLYRGDPRVEVAAKDLPGHVRFHLVPDWDHFSERRIHIRRAEQD